MDFKSKLEPQVYKGLRHFQVNKNFEIAYESEELEYFLAKTYIPDFVITFKDGHKMYIEAKGYLRPENKSQLIAVKKQHPEIDLRIVFQQDNKMSKTSRMRYSDWATKNGFIFAIKEIPRGWFE